MCGFPKPRGGRWRARRSGVFFASSAAQFGICRLPLRHPRLSARQVPAPSAFSPLLPDAGPLAGGTNSNERSGTNRSPGGIPSTSEPLCRRSGRGKCARGPNNHAFTHGSRLARDCPAPRAPAATLELPKRGSGQVEEIRHPDESGDTRNRCLLRRCASPPDSAESLRLPVPGIDLTLPGAAAAAPFCRATYPRTVHRSLPLRLRAATCRASPYLSAI